MTIRSPSPETNPSTPAEPAKPSALVNFGLSGARTAVSYAGGLIVSVIVARSLGAQQMGTYSFISWIAFTIAGFSSMGLSMAVSRFVAESAGAGHHALAAKIARASVAAQVLGAAAVSLIAASIWPLLSRHHLLFILLALASVTPAALQQTLLSLLQGIRRFDLQFSAALGGAILQISIVGAFALRHASVAGFLLAGVLSSVTIAALTLFLCRPMLLSASAPVEQDHFSGVSKRIFVFSLSLYFLWFLNLIVFDKSELFFLDRFRSAAELAYYTIAFALTARMLTAIGSILNVLFPMFVTSYAKNGPEGLREVYRRATRYIEILMVPLYLWGVPLAPRLLTWFYGAQYARAGVVVQVLLLTMLFTVPSPTSMVALFAMERQNSIVRYLLVIAVLNILLDLLLIPRYGAVGAALANGISQALAAWGPIWLLHKALPRSFPALASLKIYLAGAVSALPVFYVWLTHRSALPLFGLSLAIAALLYVGLLLILRAVETSELATAAEDMMCLVSRKAS